MRDRRIDAFFYGLFIVEGGLDVGIRIGELLDLTMRAIPTGRVRRVVCRGQSRYACVGHR
jgi:DNA-binding transcriptional LysR family regulator